jgi:SH3-like domain-containing protein
MKSTLLLSITLLALPHFAMAASPVTSDRTETEQPPLAQPQPTKRYDTPSGQPVPRYLSLKAAKTFCRSGPSFAHPVRITFMRKGLPVLVIAETTDHWRKIRDFEMDECWIHKTKLSGQETALVIEDGISLRARPDASSPERVRLGRGIIARVDHIRDGWLQVSAPGVKGWAMQTGFWGVEQPGEFSAARN